MTLYSFYIFDRHCHCIYHREFLNDSVNRENESDISKLLFGVLYSLKNVASKLGDNSGSNKLNSFSNANYRIHFIETLTNLKFVLVSDNTVDNLQSTLWELYSNYYRNNIVFNPLSPIDFKPDQVIANSNFINQTDEFLKGLPIY